MEKTYLNKKVQGIFNTNTLISVLPTGEVKCGGRSYVYNIRFLMKFIEQLLHQKGGMLTFHRTCNCREIRKVQLAWAIKTKS